jgi:O-antigen ligase
MLKIYSPGSMVMKYRDSGALLSILCIMLCVTVISILLGIISGIFGSYTFAIAIGAGLLTIIFVLRQDELAVTSILLLHLYVDWYLGLMVVAQILASVLLAIFFLGRSPQRRWIIPRALWLWFLFLILAISPAIRGSFLSRYDAAFYYPNIIFGAMLMFWLGMNIARDTARVSRLFKCIAGVGTFLAVITIVQQMTGVLLFGTGRFDVFLTRVSNYNIFEGSSVYRLGSLFVNPDWNGAFLASILFIPLGLFVVSDSLLARLFYMAEALIILSALLFTYSIGSWVSAGVGIMLFVVLVGRLNYQAWLVMFLAAALLVLALWFPTQISLLYQHGSDPTILVLRDGAWQTAMRVMAAKPLTGLGLGLQSYMLYAEPYRVPEQYKVLAHPHNSYLELGAMAGIPVLVLFVVLLLFALWLALRNWALLDRGRCALLGGGIVAVVVLSTNSLSVNVWTLPPLAAFGWVILGAVSSPLLAKSAVKRTSSDKEQVNGCPGQ